MKKFKTGDRVVLIKESREFKAEYPDGSLHHKIGGVPETAKYIGKEFIFKIYSSDTINACHLENINGRNAFSWNWINHDCLKLKGMEYTTVREVKNYGWEV